MSLFLSLYSFFLSFSFFLSLFLAKLEKRFDSLAQSLLGGTARARLAGVAFYTRIFPKFDKVPFIIDRASNISFIKEFHANLIWAHFIKNFHWYFFLQGNPLYFFSDLLEKKIRELPLNFTRVHIISNSLGIFFYDLHEKKIRELPLNLIRVHFTSNSHGKFWKKRPL